MKRTKSKGEYSCGRRWLSVLLALVLSLSLLPVTVFAAVSSTNEREIFDGEDVYHLPKTQEQILKRMVSSQQTCQNWSPIADGLKPAPVSQDYFQYETVGFPTLTQENYNRAGYTSNGVADAIKKAVNNSHFDGKANEFGKGIDTDTVFYVSNFATNSFREEINEWESTFTGYAYTVQLFYDFEIEGVESRFETPEVPADATIAGLQENGFRFSFGGQLRQLYRDGGESQRLFKYCGKKLYL